MLPTWKQNSISSAGGFAISAKSTGVLNLLINAADAIGDAKKGTNEKGVVYRVRTRLRNKHVYLHRRHGGGIRENIRSKIFDLFSPSQKEAEKERDRNLAIADTVVVERHGGTLTFESEMGKGTTFNLAAAGSSEAETF